MRAGDAPVAAVAAHAERPSWQLWRLVIALERLPQAAYVWDDSDPGVVWDAAGDPFVWDAPFVGSGFTDVFCDYAGLELVTGEPDEHELYRTGECTLTLVDPGDGRYRKRTPDGRLVYWSLDRELQVYVIDDAGTPWWLFRGRIARWHETHDGTGMVEITAYAGSAELAQQLGDHWTAGSTGQYPSQRASSILTAAGYTRGAIADVGDLQLLVAPADSHSPWEALQQAYWSDGGVVYSDADDQLRLRDRRWRNGRTDQPGLVILTDNVCDVSGAVVVWDFESSDDDDWLAGRVILTNIADPPLIADVSAPSSAQLTAAVRYTHAGPDLGSTQPDGTALAAFVLAARSQPRLAIAHAAVYLHDIRNPGYWPTVLNMRLGDKVRWWHEDRWDDGSYSLLDLGVVIQTIRHRISPEAWIVELETSPAVDYTPVELWDQTRFVWDDADPLAAWR